jgi:uroporphyrinogen-III synthase
VTPSFNNLRVLTLESRRSSEMATLVANYGGQPISAPALREVPLDSNTDAIAFIEALLRHQFDLVVLLTGVGTRALLAVVDRRGVRADFLAALAGTKIAARGPKPVAVLRELGLAPWVTAPEPNTWRELLAAIDSKWRSNSESNPESPIPNPESRIPNPGNERPLAGSRVAVQEYGVANPQLLDGLRERGAQVVSVPVYRWALPDDIEPLRAAARAVAGGGVDVAMFTTATQVVHLLQVAEGIGLQSQVREGFASIVVASIGPTTSEELREQGIAIDIEASHPKMGFLVREAAERSTDVLRTKRRRGALG